MRRTIFTEFVQAMYDADLLKDGIDVKKTVDDMLDGDFRKIFRRRRVSNLIEFGRIVHAEMAALTDAARRGHAVAGATVYCTTYPCHMCARHLIAAGISRVIYIEPYPKSLTRLLYAKSVVHDDDPPATAKALHFLPFVGITPRLYDRVFRLGSRIRKDRAGRVSRWQETDAVPVVDNGNSGAYLKHEVLLTMRLGEVLQQHQERQEGEP
ncbi:deaminase [Tistrella bauzanensis]|nr:deaminase [Tistrella bauzanensis]